MLKKAKDYMIDVVDRLVQYDTPMGEVMDQMTSASFQAVIVVDENGHPMGIITGSDLVREIVRELKSSVLSTGIAQFVMTRPVVSVPEDSLMLDTVEIMFKTRFHTLLVTTTPNEGRSKPVGLLTQIQVAKWWRDEYGIG